MKTVKNDVGRLFGAAACAAVLVSGLWPATALAGWKEMAARLPQQTNAIVAFNVQAVMRAPLAVQQNWADNWADAYQAGPVPIIPGTQRVLAGAFVEQGLQEVDWRITIMEMAEPVMLEDVGRSQGGYPEKVYDKMCVCAPTAYFVSLDPRTLASYAPPNRQSVFNWICDKPVGVASTSLRGVLSGLSGATHIVMAIDVAEQYSASGIRSRIGLNPLSRLDPEKTDLDKLAHVLASIQYVVLNVRVTDKLQATAIMQLGTGADWFGERAKAIVPEVLDRAGISVPELENWTVKVDGNRVTMAGDTSVDTMRDLLGILGLITATRPVAVSDDPAVIGKTSRAFFRTICASLDSYPKASSYDRVVTWVKRETAKIETLPLVNVDPELVAWSTEVTKRMREVTLSLATDKLSTASSVLGVKNLDAPTYGGNTTVVAGRGRYGGGYYYNYDGTYQNQTAQNIIDRENLARQRMQIVKQQQAQSLQSVARIMGDLTTNRNAIRATMTAKYKMPF
jgi:hypothetical protein